MASGQVKKHAHEENKLSQKISEMSAWGSRVFGHKQEARDQAVTNHCSTCHCPAPKKDIKQPAGVVSTEVKKKKKEKKEHDQVHGHAKSNTSNNAYNKNNMIKKDHKDETANHWFSSMADHWKEKIAMMKKANDHANIK